MENLSVKQILDADFKISKSSPVLKPFGGAIVVADPSVLTPDVVEVSELDDTDRGEGGFGSTGKH